MYVWSLSYLPRLAHSKPDHFALPTLYSCRLLFAAAEKSVTLTKGDDGEDLGFHIIGSHPTLVSTVVKGEKL